uniref:Sphingomyelin phosphodiesterase C-terminal domain-containing protein n=1 Tax=Romanomermis culicivorax TaxID=13658 RepID=A0A915KID5_ROMCU
MIPRYEELPKLALSSLIVTTIFRYESTIAAQFFGHTHNDHFGVFYENLHPTSRPTNAYYVAPSVTTFPRRSPTYRIYTLDGVYANSSFRVLNHRTFLLNLTEANKNNATVWKHEYDFKETFGLSTLFPNELSDLIIKLKRNVTLFSLYNSLLFYSVSFQFLNIPGIISETSLTIKNNFFIEFEHLSKTEEVFVPQPNARFYNTKDTYCDRKCRLDRICEIRNLVRNYPGLCDDLFADDRRERMLNLGTDDQASLLPPTSAPTYTLSQFSKMIDLRRFTKFPIPDECKPSREKTGDSNVEGNFFENESAMKTMWHSSFVEKFLSIYEFLLVIFTLLILIIFFKFVLYFWRAKSTLHSSESITANVLAQSQNANLTAALKSLQADVSRGQNDAFFQASRVL